MLKLNLQLFGGRGSGGGKGGGGSGGQVNRTSTGGSIIDQGNGQWYGENDNGTAVSILRSGKEYEVQRYNAPDAPVDLTEGLPKLYATSKAEAMRYAKGYLRSHK